MARRSSFRLRARWVLPVCGPPIRDGEVEVCGDSIGYVGPRRDGLGWGEELRDEDLGDAILAPGLINAHCHLDYTLLAGLIPPLKSFSDWIKSIMTLKAGWSYSDFADSWTRGARMLLESGCTTVVDFEAAPELLPEVADGTPLRVVSLLEMTNVKSARWGDDVLKETLRDVSRLEGSTEQVGLAPHAPYSTSADLLQAVGRYATGHDVPVGIHAAESDEEFDMFRHGRGALYQWLRGQRDMRDCGQVTPIGHLERCGLLGPRLGVVHGNYLEPEDVPRLAAGGVSVVHCPSSHAYFGHRRFPLESLIEARVNICLGTDSLASTLFARGEEASLDLFREMRVFRRQYPEINAEWILRAVTSHAARYIGRPDDLGRIAAGALADFAVIPCDPTEADPAERFVAFSGEVLGTMIGGQWAYRRQTSDQPAR